jgi:putative lipoic acid-binding regulatory protein
MKNLSQNQTKIIETIISEFEKMNQVENSSSKGLLFDANIIYDKIEKDKKLIAEVELNNRHMRALYNDKIQEDCERLNESLNVLGIEAVQKKCGIQICRIDGEKRNNELNIRYNSKRAYLSISCNKSIEKLQGIDNLYCYLTSPHHAQYFKSIEEICQTNAFAEKIQILMNY